MYVGVTGYFLCRFAHWDSCASDDSVLPDLETIPYFNFVLHTHTHNMLIQTGTPPKYLPLYLHTTIHTCAHGQGKRFLLAPTNFLPSLYQGGNQTKVMISRVKQGVGRATTLPTDDCTHMHTRKHKRITEGLLHTHAHPHTQTSRHDPCWRDCHILHHGKY